MYIYLFTFWKRNPHTHTHTHIHKTYLLILIEEVKKKIRDKIHQNIKNIFLKNFVLVILFIYISNVILLPSFPSANPYPFPPPPYFCGVLTYPIPTSTSLQLYFPYAEASSLHRTKVLPSN
jgi:F0F1-type ATP synthase membrane subunit a